MGSKTTPKRVLLLTQIAVSALALMLGGCIGPPALQQAVIGYDETTAKLDQKLLLINIARLNSGLPIHFTTTSAIAATFDWQTTIGASARFEERNMADYLNLNLGASARENPTFSIIPLSGKEFTKRILTPFEESVFNFFVFQGGRIDQSMRLMAQGIEVQKPDGDFVRVIENDPAKPRQYEEFLRIAMHLQWLHENQHLFVRTLVFEQTLFSNFKGKLNSRDVKDGFDKGFKWIQKRDGSYTFSRFVSGRTVVTNYDPRTLSDYALTRLNDKIRRNPLSFVYLDVSPEHVGGDYPIQGAIKLRSLMQILDFIAATIDATPEFYVAKDPRTGEVQTGPQTTLKIDVAKGPPSSNVPSAKYEDRYYSIADTQWDRRSFIMLSYLFQTAVGEVKDVGIPITISK